MQTDCDKIMGLLLSGNTQNIELALQLEKGLGVDLSDLWREMDLFYTKGASNWHVKQQPQLNRVEVIRFILGAQQLNFSNKGLATFELDQMLPFLQKLGHLHLQDNQLDILPDSIGKLSKLSILGLWNNQLSSLPDSMGKLDKLWALNVWNNKLTKLPASMGQLVNLNSLFLKDNLLKSLPPELEGMSSLKELNISNNQLKSVPEVIAKLEALEHLNLSENWMVKKIPSFILDLPNLKVLELNRIHLSAKFIANLRASLPRVRIEF